MDITEGKLPIGNYQRNTDTESNLMDEFSIKVKLLEGGFAPKNYDSYQRKDPLVTHFTDDV